jgi:hypothetical protein
MEVVRDVIYFIVNFISVNDSLILANFLDPVDIKVRELYSTTGLKFPNSRFTEFNPLPLFERSRLNSSFESVYDPIKEY